MLHRWIVAIVALLLAQPCLAQGVSLGHGDRTASLYRDLLKLDEGGHPLLPVSVLSNLDKLEVSASGGVRILGTGDGSVEARVPSPVEVSAIAQKTGVFQYFVVLGRAPAYDFATLLRVKNQWKERAIAVKTLSSGTTYSLAGHNFDTKITLICLDLSFASDAEAQQRVADLTKLYPNDELAVHAVVESPPQATLIARAGGSEIRAADVLWFESVGKNALHIVGNGKSGRRELELPGRIYVVPGQSGLEVVNEAELEKMLEGVVASEIFLSAPDAALRAQAVAARTDMLAKVGTRHVTDPYAICSEVHCQAYHGMGKVNPRISQAVQDTRGLVMVDAEGHLVDAYYHAVSGGHTENNENAWPGRPQVALRGRADLQDGAADLLAQGATDEAVAALLASKDSSWAAASGQNAEACRWTTEKTAQEIQHSLQGYGVSKPVAAIRVLARGVSGRATLVELTLQDQSKVDIAGELRIRKALGGSAGPKGLRSSLFLVKAGPIASKGVPDKWIFSGAGFGHGVGMDQTGAFGRAKAGQDFRQILQYYYANSKIEKLY